MWRIWRFDAVEVAVATVFVACLVACLWLRDTDESTRDRIYELRWRIERTSRLLLEHLEGKNNGGKL